MDHTEQKLQTGKVVGLILCALFALIALVCSWTSRVSGVFDAASFNFGGSAVSYESAPMIISAAYVLFIALGGVFRKNRLMRIIFSALPCLIAVCWLLPLGGMKTLTLASAFAGGSGAGIALLIEYLRCIFMIAVHVVVLINVAGGNEKKLMKTESFLLQSALIFFVSTLILSLFNSPAHQESAKFAGLHFWKEFFPELFRFSPAAFNVFDASSAALFPLWSGAVLLLLYSVISTYNVPFAPAADKPKERVRPAPARPVRKAPAAPISTPIAKTRISNDSYAQLQSLASLRSQGIISDEEFYRRKRDLLGK